MKAQESYIAIFVGNIIISDRGGLLNGWDLSKDIEDLEKMSRQPFRTGTWQFIAARLLQARESAAHTPADDWESFFHVLSWVVLRFTRHGLNPAQLTNELRNTYDDSYMDRGKVYGGENKKKSIKSRFISSDAQITPGPLLDLLKDLVDVCAVRYEDPPTREGQERYELSLQAVARDPSLAALIVDHPIKQYYDRKENLRASWMLERFREAASSQAWNMGPEGQRFENPLTHADERVITTKRRSELGSNMPRQSKRFKPMLDSDDIDMGEDISKNDVANVEEETLVDELVDDDLDEHELDDYALVASCNDEVTDWERDDDNSVDDEPPE